MHEKPKSLASPELRVVGLRDDDNDVLIVVTDGQRPRDRELSRLHHLVFQAGIAPFANITKSYKRFRGSHVLLRVKLPEGTTADTGTSRLQQVIKSFKKLQTGEHSAGHINHRAYAH